MLFCFAPMKVKLNERGVAFTYLVDEKMKCRVLGKCDHVNVNLHGYICHVNVNLNI